jgi:hypothetical protein
LIFPTAAYTHTDVVGAPELAGPSFTITRLAWVARARRLRFENLGGFDELYWQDPFDEVGKTLK